MYFTDTFYAVVECLSGLEPFIEKPGKVYMRVLDNRGAEIFEIRMCKKPLAKVVLHRCFKERVAKGVLQVVEHGGCFVIHCSIPAALAQGAVEIIGMSVKS